MFFWHDDHLENMTIAFNCIYISYFFQIISLEKITVEFSLFTERLVLLLCSEGFKDSERKQCFERNAITLTKHRDNLTK